MPRLRNPRSGVVVVVDDATAAQLGGSHEPADKAQAKKAPAKKTATKPSDEN